MDSCEKKTKKKMWSWIILGVIAGVILATYDPATDSNGKTVCQFFDDSDARAVRIAKMSTNANVVNCCINWGGSALSDCTCDGVHVNSCTSAKVLLRNKNICMPTQENMVLLDFTESCDFSGQNGPWENDVTSNMEVTATTLP